jgi:hypothetical protein
MPLIIDRHVELNRHAQRRMELDFKPIDNLLTRWGKDARHDGAPRWPVNTILGRMIEQGLTGASQIGAPEPTVPREIQIIDWCVAQLRDMKRKVIFIDYVTHPGAPEEQKRRRLGMSHTAWQNNLKGAREIILTLYNTKI